MKRKGGFVAAAIAANTPRVRRDTDGTADDADDLNDPMVVARLEQERLGIVALKRKFKLAATRYGTDKWALKMMEYDLDHSGCLSSEEFSYAVRMAGIPRSVLSGAELQKLFMVIDSDGSGQIQLDELQR